MPRLNPLFIAIACIYPFCGHADTADAVELTSVAVQGTHTPLSRQDMAPSSDISAEQLQALTITTVEDALKSQPNVIVRKRYVGDPNATLGIRGSNMFQSTRSLVFADGMPLHYHLQTRWSGAPRWSVVAPNELEKLEVIYGPYSAEYAGNAMGGVINLTTKTPQKREISINGALFQQDYDINGRDESLKGGRFFTSYADKIGNWSLFGFYNHLENKGQPQSLFASSDSSDENPTVVSGGLRQKDAFGDDVIIYGDSGVVDTSTDLYKLKAVYQNDGFEWRNTIAYEQRENDTTDTRSFLKDANGDTQYGGHYIQNGTPFYATDSRSRFGDSRQDRNSLWLGTGITAPVSDHWYAKVDISQFSILTDERIRTSRKPSDPAFDGSENIQEFKGSGWQTLDTKLATDQLFNRADMSLSTGYHYDLYKLQINTGRYNPTNNEPQSSQPDSGGDTETQALFSQYQWRFADDWDVNVGVRYEQWRAMNGFRKEGQHPDRKEHAWSPKFAVGWQFAPGWSTRYSLAKATRFPIVEELYNNVDITLTQNIANAELKPEQGIHQNLNLSKQFDRAELSINLFYDRVQDTIFNQRIVNRRSTFLNVEQVNTKGAELTYDIHGLFHPSIDMIFNTSYTDARIARNSYTPESEGKQFPRIPEWQNNLIVTWHALPQVDLNSHVRRVSNSYNTLDNSDTESNVFGAIDAYTFVDLKANWQVTHQAKLALGIDNLLDEEAYVHHPYPGRTVILEGGYRF